MVSHQKKSTNNKTVVINRAVKVRNATPKTKAVALVKSRRSRQSKAANGGAPVFGPVSTIDTAPVSIGNTVRGAAPIVMPINDGVRVKGRDFLLTVVPTSTAFTGWQLVGGAPITPACLTASVLKSYSQMYAQYNVHAIALHFITAAITTDAGSIMMYIGKNRTSPGLNPSSTNLLPFVMSDEHTTISPIWKNTSAVFYPPPNWYTTDLINDEPLERQACGEFFILSKITQADAPGYVLIDYDISFRGHQTNIKTSLLPATRMKYSEVNLSMAATAVTINSTVVELAMNSGFLLDGTTTSTAPSGLVVGDIYKVIMTTQGATATNSSVGELFSVKVGPAAFAAQGFPDGFTCYAVAEGSVSLVLYSDYPSACAQSNAIYHGKTATVTIGLHAFISLVGSISGTMLQSSY